MADIGISIGLEGLQQYNAGLGSALATTQRVSGAMGQAAGRAAGSFRSVANEIPGIGRALTLLSNPIVALGATVATLSAGFVQATRTAANLEEQLSTVGAFLQIDKASAEFAALTEEAKRLGATTEFTATQAAQAMEFLAKAGFDTNQVLAATGSTLSLATVGSLDLARASDIASDVLSQFQEPAENLGKVVDIIAKTTVTANTNVTQFADAMNYLGPTAKALGISLEESSAAIGILSSSGLKGSLATRALGTSLVGLADPTAKASKEINKIGLNAFDTQGNFVGLASIIGQLEKAYADFTPEQRQASLASIFGKEAIQELNILLAKGSVEIRKYTKEIEEAGKQNGAFAENVRKLKLDNLNGALKSLSSAWEALQIAISDGALPAITEFVKGTADATRGLANFIEEAGGLTGVVRQNADILAVAGLALLTYNGRAIAAAAASNAHRIALIASNLQMSISAALSGALVVAQSAYITVTSLLAGRIGLATAAQRLWNIAIAANPLGLILTGITAVVAAIVIYNRTMSESARLNKVVADSRESIVKTFAAEKGELDSLFLSLKKDTTTREEKIAIIQKLRDKYGELIPQYLDEKAALIEVEQAHYDVNKAIISGIVTREKARIAEDLLSKRIALTSEVIDIQNGKYAQTVSGFERLTNGAKSFAVAISNVEGISAEQFALDDRRREIEAIDKDMEGLSGRFQDVEKSLTSAFSGTDLSAAFAGAADGAEEVGNKVTTAGEKATITAGSLAALQERLKQLNEQIVNSPLGSTSLAALAREAGEVEKEIAKVEARLARLRTGIEIVPIIREIQTPEAASLSVAANIDVASIDVSPIDALKVVADSLGLSMEFVNQNFRTTGELLQQVDSFGFQLASNFGATAQQAIGVAMAFEEMGIAIKRALVDGAGEAFRLFGQGLGDALTKSASFGSAMVGVLTSIVNTLLVEVPKLVGLHLLQIAVGLGFPAGVPFAVAGAGLLVFSGLAGSLLKKLGGKNADATAAVPNSQQLISQATQAFNQQGGGQPITPFGLGNQNAPVNQGITVMVSLDGQQIQSQMAIRTNIDNQLRGRPGPE